MIIQGACGNIVTRYTRAKRAFAVARQWTQSTIRDEGQWSGRAGTGPFFCSRVSRRTILWLDLDRAPRKHQHKRTTRIGITLKHSVAAASYNARSDPSRRRNRLGNIPVDRSRGYNVSAFGK